MQESFRSENRSLPLIESGTTLGAAAKILTDCTSDTAFVTDTNGRRIGLVTLRQITSALSSAVEEPQAAVA
ncbi:hypothetical protein N182_22950 [Sinorhizobium sp. GL2]|nr:hypothetical protein N182_22950 [Sinorhizobium sp. GL2]